VHETTIAILREVVKDKELLKLLEVGYNEFISMANDLSDAKNKRTKAQYYTGSKFMKEKYREQAKLFLNLVVTPYLNRFEELLK
jgi:hypothetical protein